MRQSSPPASRFVRACLLACLVLLALPIGAQEEAPAEAEAPEPEPAPVLPTALSVVDVAERSDELDEHLRRVNATLQPDETVARIQVELPQLIETIDEELDQPITAAQGVTELGELGTRLSDRQKRLQGYRQTLTERAQSLDEYVEALEDRREVWTLTREESVGPETPDAVRNSITGAISQIDNAVSRLIARRSDLLTLQTQVSEAGRETGVLREAVSEALDQARVDLLKPATPPLWDALSNLERDQSLAEQVGRAFDKQRDTVAEFWAQRRTRVVLHLLATVILFILVVSLRPRARRWAEEDPDLAHTAALLERSIAITLLLAAAPIPWLYPSAPAVIGNLVGVLVLIPAARVVPRLIAEDTRPLFYGVTGLFLVDQIRVLLEATPLVERAILLLELAFATAGSIWLLRPARMAALPATSRFLPIVGLALRSALVVMLASLALNFLGYFALSKVLADGVFDSAYIAFIVYAAVRAAEGLLRALLRIRPLSLLNGVRLHRQTIMRRLRLVIRWSAGVGWLYVLFGAFQIRDVMMAAVGDMLSYELTLGSLSFSLADVLLFVGVVAGGFWLSRLLRTLLEEEVVPRVSLPRGVGYALSASTQYIVGLGALFLAIGATGVDTGRFAFVAGALGVGIGFGLQNVVNNFVSGLILLVERPVQVGDTVETENLIGDVRRIGIRSSTIRTWQGAEVILPNSMLIADRVINWTMADRHRRVDLPIGVAYGTDPQRVLDLLLGLAQENSEVLKHPAPAALFMGFGDSSLNFELRVWTGRFENHLQLKSELAVAVNTALAEAGITIPFPQRDVHIIPQQ